MWARRYNGRPMSQGLLLGNRPVQIGIWEIWQLIPASSSLVLGWSGSGVGFGVCESSDSFGSAARSCFSRSVKCWSTTMGNGFQVIILDSEAVKSWHLDWIQIWPSVSSYNVSQTRCSQGCSTITSVIHSDKMVELYLVEGLLSTGATPSSFSCIG